MKQQGNEQGRPMVGNRYGKERPRRPTEAGHLEVMMAGWDLDTCRDVVAHAVGDGRNGDSHALASDIYRAMKLTSLVR